MYAVCICIAWIRHMATGHGPRPSPLVFVCVCVCTCRAPVCVREQRMRASGGGLHGKSFRRVCVCVCVCMYADTVQPNTCKYTCMTHVNTHVCVYTQHLNEDRVRAMFGFGGVRIEDNLFVTDTGARLITNVPRTVRACRHAGCVDVIGCVE